MAQTPSLYLPWDKQTTLLPTSRRSDQRGCTHYIPYIVFLCFLSAYVCLCPHSSQWESWHLTTMRRNIFHHWSFQQRPKLADGATCRTIPWAICGNAWPKLSWCKEFWTFTVYHLHTFVLHQVEEYNLPVSALQFRIEWRRRNTPILVCYSLVTCRGLTLQKWVEQSPAFHKFANMRVGLPVRKDKPGERVAINCDGYLKGFKKVNGMWSVQAFERKSLATAQKTSPLPSVNGICKAWSMVQTLSNMF